MLTSTASQEDRGDRLFINGSGGRVLHGGPELVTRPSLMRLRWEWHEKDQAARTTIATATAVSAIPASAEALRVSPNSTYAMRAVTGGVR